MPRHDAAPGGYGNVETLKRRNVQTGGLPIADCRLSILGALRAKATRWTMGLVILTFLPGCPPPRGGGVITTPSDRPVVEVLPPDEAIAIVNRNIELIGGTLRATGSVDGAFRDANGRMRNFSVDGTLFYLRPGYFRFDLRKLGERQFLFGSNPDRYWFYSAQEKEYLCGRHGAIEDLPDDLPVRPDLIVDALGLTPIPSPTSLAGYKFQTPRVAGEFQQILFFAPSPTGPGLVLYQPKEYWLDTRDARLVRRVIFRDTRGVCEMDAQLSDYRPLAPGGPLLPHSLDAEWPTTESRLHFQIQKWTIIPEVGPQSKQFQAPRECDTP